MKKGLYAIYFIGAVIGLLALQRLNSDFHSPGFFTSEEFFTTTIGPLLFVLIIILGLYHADTKGKKVGNFGPKVGIIGEILLLICVLSAPYLGEAGEILFFPYVLGLLGLILSGLIVLVSYINTFRSIATTE